MSVSTSGSTGYPIGDAIRTGVLDTYNLATDIYSMYQQNQLNKWQQSFAEKQFDYQKELNQLVMDREDTAVQRRVSDLTSAGLNPNLAAGAAAGSQSFSAGGSAPSMKAPSSRGMQLNALIDLQQRKAQVNMLEHQSQLLEAQQGYYDALSGKVSEETKNVGLKSDEILHNLAISKDLNMRTNDYGSGIVREIVGVLQYLGSNNGKGKFNSISDWLKRHTPTPDNTDPVSDQGGRSSPDFTAVNAVRGIISSASVKEVQDFLNSITENDVVSTMKRMSKDFATNFVDTGSVIKQLWRKWKDSFSSAPKMLDNGLF